MSIEERAKNEAAAVLAYFNGLETLGKFAGEPVTAQKELFLQFTLVNFARREKLLHPAD
jgi:hypothetical protein